MLIYVLFAALVLLAPALGLIPPVKRNGARCFNSLMRIEMLPRDHPTTYLADGVRAARYGPVFAQELAEWWCAWAGAFLIGAPIAALISLSPFWPAVVLVPFATWRWRVTDWGRRQLELIGHACEIEWGKRAGLAFYANDLANADRTRRGYAVFHGETSEQIAVALRLRRAPALVLLALLGHRIARETRHRADQNARS